MAVCSLGGYVLSEHLSVELRLSTLATDSSGKLDILGHDGDTLGVDSAQVGVLKQTNKVSLRSFLQGKNNYISNFKMIHSFPTSEIFLSQGLLHANIHIASGN